MATGEHRMQNAGRRTSLPDLLSLEILVGGAALVAATMEGMLLLAGLCLAYEAAITGTILTLTWRRPEIL